MNIKFPTLANTHDTGNIDVFANTSLTKLGLSYCEKLTGKWVWVGWGYEGGVKVTRG